MTSNIKMFGTCYPNANYYKNNDNGSEWHWTGRVPYIWSLLNLINYTLVTDVSESNVTHPWVQTIADGKADTVALGSFVYTHERFHFVDFVFPLSRTENRIFRLADTVSHVSPLEKLLDLPTWICLLGTLLLTTAYICAYLRFQGLANITYVLLQVYGVFLGQDMTGSILNHSRSATFHICLGLFFTGSLFFATVLGSVLTTQLIIKPNTAGVNTLNDIAARSELRIIFDKYSYLIDSIDYYPSLKALEDRIDYLDLEKEEDFVQALQWILDGSHVMINDVENVEHLWNVQSAENRLIYPRNKFAYGTASLISQLSGIVIRKESPIRDRINIHAMRIMESGLLNERTEPFRQGITVFSPEKQPQHCEAHEENREVPLPRDFPDKVHALGLQETWISFALLGVGLLIACGAFIVEQVHNVALVSSNLIPNNEL